MANKLFVVKNEDGLYIAVKSYYHSPTKFTDNIMKARTYRSIGAIKNSRDCGCNTDEYKAARTHKFAGAKRRIVDGLTPVRVELRLVEMEQ